MEGRLRCVGGEYLARRRAAVDRPHRRDYPSAGGERQCNVAARTTQPMLRAGEVSGCGDLPRASADPPAGGFQNTCRDTRQRDKTTLKAVAVDGKRVPTTHSMRSGPPATPKRPKCTRLPVCVGEAPGTRRPKPHERAPPATTRATQSAQWTPHRVLHEKQALHLCEGRPMRGKGGQRGTRSATFKEQGPRDRQ